MKLETMSKNIVKLIQQLSLNDGLAMLIANDVVDPFDPNLPAVDKKNLFMPNDFVNSRLYPLAFDPDATLNDRTFVRVYYNQGQLDNTEVIAESQINIDIIVAKSLWLIHDINGNPVVRPYEIMGRIIDLLGSRSANTSIKLQFDGFQQLAVNGKFECVRLYANYFSVEA
jgi:hypothetical protein